MIVFINDFFEITEQNGKVYLKTMKSGFPLKDFDAILRSFPRIKLTNFAVLKNVLSKENATPVEVGQWLPNLEIEVSRDKMYASLFIHETPDFIRRNQQQLHAQINQLLEEKRIVHGILPIHMENIMPGKAILIAQGTPPVKGEDAKITYLEIPERKPVIREDGKADYYDMNFIFEIQEGSWLGEKIPPQSGQEGKNVYGELLPAVSGRDAPLKYDHKSAYECDEDGKVVLRSRISGVLEHLQGQISVNHHLPINGDVGIETGNLQFDGSITIRGTIQNSFSVTAKGDISIEGPEGVSGAKLIKSIDGDIFIRGGIFGLGETRIEAGGSIFVKHVNEANLIAGNEIHIGFYAIGSYLRAHSILVDERKGKIIGGTAIANSQIVTAISGNRLERRTELIIHSINKQEAYAIIQEKAAYLKTLQEEVLSLEEQVGRLSAIANRLNTQQIAAFEQAKLKLKQYNEEALEIDHEIKKMMNDLRNVGKEEIYVTKEANAGTYIQIGKKSSILSKMTKGKFALEFGELNV
ncbi:FapA family protein [Lysinibacillus sp. KU-BSD001]|uniref:DUF342 domain-containing protein n=1 Tax=Lysinibacillus sp. KU-BSD001 TaxID=3141328 RepID=UPI0036ECF9BA